MARMSSVKSKLKETALASGLVTEQQIRAAVARVMQTHPEIRDQANISDKRLGSQLVKMNVLTTYQADQLASGRTKLTLGSYIITDWIGQGGMGQVFKAVHQMLGRESAVKVLPLHKTTPEAIENFRREIRAQAKLNHKNLVQAFDAGEDGNVHFLVVEYVPGTDLRRLVRTKGKLSVQQAANIIKQSAEGLAYAHEVELIHRDIKPGNILVTPDGIAKISDLGLAFYLNDPNDPRVGKVVGTADYLSPEQIKTPNHITSTSDIYSLGCTLYYAITGKVPFPGGNSRNKAKRHLEETPWHPRRFNEEVSDDFVDLIGDMMEKDPKQRIQTAAEVAERLSPWAADNSPLREEDLDERPRWMPAPSQAIDAQDTDVNADVAELAMSELTDDASQGEMQQTYSGTDQMTDSGSSITQKPPVPMSVVESYKNAGRLQDENVFSFSALLITGVTFLAIGILIGFIACYWTVR
jgi:serine/threonine protein kinase